MRRYNAREVASAVLGALFGIMGFVHTGPLDAWTAWSPPQWISLGSAAVVNYDSIDSTLPLSNVDWPVNLVFYNNAEVDKVKNILKPTFYKSGNTMRTQVHQGPSCCDWSWDEDSGVKNAYGNCPVNIHMRLYAYPVVDTVYSNTHGYIVYATSHHDVHEHPSWCTDRWFGDSEWAEHQFGTEFINRGYGVCRDCWGYRNYEPLRRIGDHQWDNNGWSTAISIP